MDSYLVKYWALKFATDAAVTVLRVDQVRKKAPLGFIFATKLLLTLYAFSGSN